MPAPAYKTALVTYPHTQALKDGTVVPRTFTFDFEDVPVIIKAFRRMVRGLEFDISEMAITTYLTARAHGKKFTAIPVFPMRAFHHGAILYNTTSDIRAPKDLEGRRVGVNRGYTVTTGLWARSILQHEYGVDLKKVTWVLSGDEHVAEYRPPANVVPIEQGRTLEEMLRSGEIAAANGIAADSPEIKPLIPNAKDAGLNGLRHGGLYPINHTVVVKDEVLAAHPDLAADLFDAFVRAKRIYVDRLKAGGIAEPTAADKTFAAVMAITGDPLPYGVAPNRREIEAVIQYSVEQGILQNPFSVEEIFAKGTLDLVG
jgi:ABC-type nitrate/sulfonate/bicarbonate transport system substrate-binding protein